MRTVLSRHQFMSLANVYLEKFRRNRQAIYESYLEI